MGSARTLDRIDTAPRFCNLDADQFISEFADLSTPVMLEILLRKKRLGNVATVSSFGAESVVLLNMIAAIDPAVPVFFLDTGKHFPETLAYRDTLIALLGLRDVRNITPDPDILLAMDAHGSRWSYDPDGCCDIRKVQPLATALAGFDAQFTGRKAFQATTRNALPRFEIAEGMLKINPLADWDKLRIADYIAVHDLPLHPLVEQGYPSIGCAPCTSRINPGEDERAGRWRGQDKVECGLHTPVSVPVRVGTP